MSKKDLTQLVQHSRPSARKDDLSITHVGDETVVYDQLTLRASCLNAVTATVWGACDGENDTNAILEVVRRAGFQDAAEEVVWLALIQLDQAGLLDSTFVPTKMDKEGLSRRQMLRSLGKGAVATIPLVSTINIQSATAALSTCFTQGTSCTAHSDCCSGFCLGVLIGFPLICT